MATGVSDPVHGAPASAPLSCERVAKLSNSPAPHKLSLLHDTRRDHLLRIVRSFPYLCSLHVGDGAARPLLSDHVDDTATAALHPEVHSTHSSAAAPPPVLD